MAQRLQLQALLEEILGSDHVYFQPPPNVVMKYPAIEYHRDYGDTKFADNAPYTHETRYQLTVIDPDPDSPILDKIAMLPKCLYSRHFATAGLNHDIYDLYF